MTYVKAATSPRARKYLATAEGRRLLLRSYLGGEMSAGDVIRIESSAVPMERNYTIDPAPSPKK
jgi:hypothetical protein